MKTNILLETFIYHEGIKYPNQCLKLHSNICPYDHSDYYLYIDHLLYPTEMATQLKFAFLVCLLLFILMEEAKPSQAKKGGGKFKKLADRVKKLEESMEVEDECKGILY